MRLSQFIKCRIVGGVPYLDAVQLCLSMHCVKELCPGPLLNEISTRDSLAEVFAELFRTGHIRDFAVCRTTIRPGSGTSFTTCGFPASMRTRSRGTTTITFGTSTRRQGATWNQIRLDYWQASIPISTQTITG